MKQVKKVVLAYSGGLDTSIIMPWIKENYGGAEIVAYCGDVGQGDDLEAVRKKALQTGASKCVVEDLREEFIRDYAFKALSAGAVYEDNYLLGTALARPLLAYRQVQCALREGADALAHGATGKGNDQVRFEVTYGAFAPHLRVIAPWREWTIRSREDALAYAAAPQRARRPVAPRPLQPRRQPLAPLPRGRQPRGHLERAPQGDVQAHRGSPGRPRHAAGRDDRLRGGDARLRRRRAARAGGPRGEAQQGRGRPRGGPPRPRGEPPRGDQVARRLRDARGHRPASSPTASWSGSCSTATPCTSSSPSPCATPSSSTTASGSPPCARPSPRSWTRPRRRSRAR